MAAHQQHEATQQSQRPIDQRSGPECCLSRRGGRIPKPCYVIGCGLADTEIEELEVPHEQPDQNQNTKTSLSHQSEIERHDHQRYEHRRRCARQIDEGVAFDAHRLLSRPFSYVQIFIRRLCVYNTTCTKLGETLRPIVSYVASVRI